jgi:hypothetical protein
LLEGDHSIAVVAANRATAAKVVIVRRFMGSLPVEWAPTSTLPASRPKSAILGLYGGFSFADLRRPPTSPSTIFRKGAIAGDRRLRLDASAGLCCLVAALWDFMIVSL